MTNNTLVGYFDDRDTAQRAVNDLIDAGVSRDDISIVSNDGSGGMTTETYDASGNLAGEGAASGLTSGAVVGGLAGVLIGFGFTVLPIAGVLLAGPIAGLIAGAASGAVTGGVVGGLIGLGIPKEHAELYAEGIRRGGTLVTVGNSSVDESRVREILNQDGAIDIQARGAAWRAEGYTGYDPNAKPYNDAEIAQERNRYSTSNINSDWNDTANAPAPSMDDTYAATTTPSTGYVEPTMGASDDEGYRRHFETMNTGRDYDRYAPAYGYGRDLANDPTYGSGDWDANESNYRSRWEERNPGTWDEFKASVRHAYDSAKNAVTRHNDQNRANLY